MSVPYDPGYASLGGPAPIFVQAKPSWSRPGNVTAACVIAFIVGGFSLMGAMVWLTMSQGSRAFRAGFESQWLVFGLVDLAVAILLIVGASGLLGRQGWGRMLLYAGAGLDAAYSTYNVVQAFLPGDGWTFSSPFSILFPVLDIVIIVCISLPPTAHFLATRNPLYPTPGTTYAQHR